MSYYQKILVAAFAGALLFFVLIWMFTAPDYADMEGFKGMPTHTGVRVALGVLVGGGGFVCGALLGAVFAAKEGEHIGEEA